MLTHPTLNLLHDLGLHGMAKGFKELEQNTETRALQHGEERLGVNRVHRNALGRLLVARGELHERCDVLDPGNPLDVGQHADGQRNAKRHAASHIETVRVRARNGLLDARVETLQ